MYTFRSLGPGSYATVMANPAMPYSPQGQMTPGRMQIDRSQPSPWMHVRQPGMPGPGQRLRVPGQAEPWMGGYNYFRETAADRRAMGPFTHPSFPGYSFRV